MMSVYLRQKGEFVPLIQERAIGSQKFHQGTPRPLAGMRRILGAGY